MKVNYKLRLYYMDVYHMFSHVEILKSIGFLSVHWS